MLFIYPKTDFIMSKNTEKFRHSISHTNNLNGFLRNNYINWISGQRKLPTNI